MNISIKREQNNARISSAEREKFGAKLNSKILSPLRRDGYKAGMIMMLIALSTMLLTTACSSEDDLVNNTAENTVTSKGYALPVTVSATRGGDATRATFDGSKLNFSAGDKLFVSGIAGDYDYEFAGELDYVSEGTFSGTIYTSKEWTGTADALFTAASADVYVNATLLPAGYGSYGFLTIENNDTEDKYDDFISSNKTYTLATSKAAGVEQFSYEEATSYSSGFELEPQNAILNFTITGLAASTNVAVSLTSYAYNITGTVTTDSDGKAVFGAGVEDGEDLYDFSLTVAGNPVTLVTSSKPLVAGHIYNIARVANAINGKFTINSSGDQVQFAKGNLRCISLDSGTSWSWSFFEHQYDRYSSFNAYSWDKFGWVGESGTLTSGIELWGASISTTKAGYGASTTEMLKSDWGNVPGIGSGWRTLSGGDSGEWNYLFNTRSASTVGGTSNGRYAKAKVNDVQGVILFPDTYTHPDGVTAPTYVNTANASFDSNTYTIAAWAKMEAAGCVFLPTAGSRVGTGVSYVDRGYYWSSTAYNNNEEFACDVYFGSDFLYADDQNGRWWGQSVRLVREVQ